MCCFVVPTATNPNCIPMQSASGMRCALFGRGKIKGFGQCDSKTYFSLKLDGCVVS